MSEAKKRIVGTSELASILGLTDSRIRQLERSGILTKIERGKYDLASSVQGYCSYLKEVADPPTASDSWQELDGQGNILKASLSLAFEEYMAK